MNTSIVWKYLVAFVITIMLSACGGGDNPIPIPIPDGDDNPVVDTVKPIITIRGGDVTIEAGTDYIDQGADATDNVTVGLTPAIVTDCSTVNTSAVGVYTCTYNVSDTAGNAADEKIRTVNVVDTTGAKITIQGANPDSVLAGTLYVAPVPGATAVDNVDGDVSSLIVVMGMVDTNVLGPHYIHYNIPTPDSSGNYATEVIRTVTVLAVPDTTPPVITPNGASPQSLYVDDAFVPLGATAQDDVDGIITANLVENCNVNTAMVGTYVCTYDVSDSSGNPATQVAMTYDVVAVPMATTGKFFYPGFDQALKDIYGGDGAIYVQDLWLATTTRLWGGYQCLPNGCGVMYPDTIVPARNGGKVVSQGGNLMGFHVLDVSVSPAVDFYATPGSSSLYDGECSRTAQGSFDVTPDAEMAVFSSRCFPGGFGSGIPEFRSIVIMKLDGTKTAMRVTTSTTDMVTSPVFGKMDMGTGYVDVYFVLKNASETSVYKQVVDLVTGTRIGVQTLVVSDVADGVRAMSFNTDYSKFAFMRVVGVETHIFVKTVATGAEVDIGAGTDPYWSTNGSGLVLYSLNSRRFAKLADGTGRVEIPVPANYSISPVESLIVPAPAGY